MKIAIITPGWLPVPAVDGGAVEVLITYLIEGNERTKNFEFDVYTKNSQKLDDLTYSMSSIIQIKPDFIVKCKCKINNFLNKLSKKIYIHYFYNQQIVKELKKKKYDYVIIQNNMTLYYDIYHQTKHKDNLIFHVHNDVIKKECKMSKLIIDTAYKIIAVSSFLEKKINSVKLNNKTYVLNNCIDLKKFNYRPQIRNIVREQYEIDDNDLVFLYSGRINEDKGVLELVKAFIQLKEFSNLKLMIVGSSWFNITEKDEYLEQIIKISEEIEDSIIFTGYKYPSEMPHIYHAGDIGIIPSLWEEPFGVVALEMMAMRLPIIATRSGGLSEVLSEDGALLINKNEEFINNLAKEMRLLIQDTALREQLKAEAYLRILNFSDYHLENYFNNFKKIIES